MKPSKTNTLIYALFLLAGADGAGKTAMGKKLKVQDAHAAVAKMSGEQMIKVVTDGKGQDMNGYGKQFSAEQIKGVVDYYRGLGK